MGFHRPRILGSTGLSVGPLGVASSYGAPAEAFEEAFEKGCNYFYWGSMRKSGMAQAIRNICGSGKREELVIVIQSYSRSAALMESFFKKAIRSVDIERADVLLLGWYNSEPSQRILDRAMMMKEKGLYRFLGISGHNRSLFPKMALKGGFDLFHIRYNAAHRGAESEIFPHIRGSENPGLISYTATRWGQLLNPRKMPPGENPPHASSCYRFVLTNASVDVCICGPKDRTQMKEALSTIELGPLEGQELERMKRIGDYVHEHSGKFY